MDYNSLILFSLPGTLIVVTLYLFYFEKCLKCLWDYFSHYFKTEYKKEKQIMFQKLTEDINNMKNLPEKFKILEIGGGWCQWCTSANFSFINQPVEWTTIQPNDIYSDYFIETKFKSNPLHDFKGVVKVNHIYLPLTFNKLLKKCYFLTYRMFLKI